MSTKIEKLAARRAELVLQAAQQRELLSDEWQLLGYPLNVADTFINLATFLRRKPWLVAIGSALIGALGFRKVIVPPEASTLWKFAQGAFNLWQKFRRD